jgi:hypothetical protein
MNELHTLAVTTSSGETHVWVNVMWAVASDDTLLIYGLEDTQVSPKSYKVAQFAKGAWDFVEIVQDEDEEDESYSVYYISQEGI